MESLEPETVTLAPITDLGEYLEERLFGQHLVLASLPPAVKQHQNDQDPKKAMVMSFHGWPGTGKRYTVTLLAKYLYTTGLGSDFVKIYNTSQDFPDGDKIEEYKRKLETEIDDQAYNFPGSLFIFDEIDDMPAGLIDCIQPFLRPKDKLCCRICTYVFISEIAGEYIARAATKAWKNTSPREKIPLKDTQSVVELGSYNKPGGLYKAELIDRKLIDVFVPFLPLENWHVQQCARYQFVERGYYPTKKTLITIAQELDYIPPGFELFASTGCKGVQHRVIHFLKGGVSEEGDDDIAELAKIASDKRQIPDEQLRIA